MDVAVSRYQPWHQTERSSSNVVIYPDSNKLSAAERLPESDGRKHYFRIEDEVDYWEGEQA